MAHEQPETIEWVGGRAILPTVVEEDGGYQPEILLWLELPSGLIVGSEIRDPRRAGPSLGRVLRKAMRSPMAGPPRRPQRVRVAETALAHELRVIVGVKTEVVVAPTPEVDAAVRDLIAFNARDRELPRALADGRVSPEAVEQLFAEGELLYTAEPWRSAQDDQILRLDIPELGVSGACVSIIGALGESLGFLVFPSTAKYAGFLAAAERYAAGDDVGGFATPILSLTFEEGGPELAHREPDGTLRTLVEDDVRIAAATAAALASFFARHRAWFESASRTRISETFTEIPGLTVKLSAPALVPATAPRREVARSERASWLSIWEVRGVEHGERLSLVDLLSGEHRVVPPPGAPLPRVREALLSRVVEREGESLLVDLHPQPLPPREAAQIVAQLRRKLKHEGAIPIERLRKAGVARELIRRWEESVVELLSREPPVVCNTDDDEILWTVDHFEVRARDRADIETALMRVPELYRDGLEGKAACYTFRRLERAVGGRKRATILGSVHLSDSALRLEANSIRRANELRVRLGAACGEHLRHRIREHADPMAGVGRRPLVSREAPLLDAERQSLVRQFKQAHYAEWLDIPVPALGNRTPRAAARTRAGRAKLAVLLKELERGESALAEGERFDVNVLRRELGIDG